MLITKITIVYITHTTNFKVATYLVFFSSRAINQRRVRKAKTDLLIRELSTTSNFLT